jgi:hypothetical protein
LQKLVSYILFIVERVVYDINWIFNCLIFILFFCFKYWPLKFAILEFLENLIVLFFFCYVFLFKISSVTCWFTGTVANSRAGLD